MGSHAGEELLKQIRQRRHLSLVGRRRAIALVKRHLELELPLPGNDLLRLHRLERAQGDAQVGAG